MFKRSLFINFVIVNVNLHIKMEKNMIPNFFQTLKILKKD